MGRCDSPDRSRRIQAGGVTVAVAAMVVATAAAARQPVIPWLNEHPRKSSAHPPLAPACRADDLRAQLLLQGATGSLVGGINLTNNGLSACALLGWPRLRLSGAAARATHWRVKRLARSPQPLDVLADPPGSLRALAPGKSAAVALFWSNWCGPGSEPTGSSGRPPSAIVLGLASGTSIAVPTTHAPRCDAPQHPSTLSIAPFTPTTRRLPASSRLPLKAAIVGSRPVQVKPGLRAFQVHRGELLRYRVGLTNTGRRVFRFAPSSCPVYIEELTPSAPDVYLLNCRPVATIESRATVLFAMQIRVPATTRLGAVSLTWELAPKTYLAPFAPATLWVVP